MMGDGTASSIDAAVRQLLAEITLTDEPRTAPAAAALDDVGVDSVGMIDLVYRLEETFGISLPDTEVTPDNFATIETVVALVTRKCNT